MDVFPQANRVAHVPLPLISDVIIPQFLGGAPLADAKPVLRDVWAKVPDFDPRKVDIRKAYADHEDIANDAEIWKRAVPIGAHGDAFPVPRTSCDTLYWAGFLLHASLRASEFKVLISCVIKQTVTAETYATWWKVGGHGLRQLCWGRWAKVDADGRQWPVGTKEAVRASQMFADGFVASSGGWGADMEWIANGLKLQSYHVSRCIHGAWATPARTVMTRGSHPSACPRRRGTTLTRLQLGGEQRGQTLTYGGGSMVVGFPPPHVVPSPCAHIRNVHPDAMHICCLGLCHHVVGNVLCELPYTAGTCLVAPLALGWRRCGRMLRANTS